MNWSILLNLLSRLASAFFGLLVSVLISRELGAEIKGNHALFVVGVSIIHLFTNLFAGSSLGYLAPRFPLRFLMRMSGFWSLLSGGICGLILWLLGLLPEGMEWYIIGSGILFAVWNSYAAILLGRQQNTAYNILLLINPFLSAAFLSLLLFTVQPNLYAFANGYAASQFITFVLAFVILKRLPETLKDAVAYEWKKLFKHGIYIQLANITQFFNYRMLYYLIDEFFGRAFLGVYSNALALAESIWMVSKSISTVQFSRIVNSANDGEARSITAKYVPISALVSFVGIVILLLIPGSFFSSLFGRDFSEVSGLMPWISPAILALSISTIYAHYFAGKGFNDINFYGSLINLLALLLVFFVSEPFLGKMAAPFSASLSFVAMTAYQAGMYYFGPVKHTFPKA